MSFFRVHDNVTPAQFKIEGRKISIAFKSSVLERMDAHSNETGLPKVRIVRQAIEEMLAEWNPAPGSLLAQIDAYSERTGIPKSRAIAKAVEAWLEGRDA